MRQLTMVTLIFLPLTFLAGYFGMNFSQEYWHVLTNNGPIYFWEIAHSYYPFCDHSAYILLSTSVDEDFESTNSTQRGEGQVAEKQGDEEASWIHNNF